MGVHPPHWHEEKDAAQVGTRGPGPPKGNGGVGHGWEGRTAGTKMVRAAQLKRRRRCAAAPWAHHPCPWPMHARAPAPAQVMVEVVRGEIQSKAKAEAAAEAEAARWAGG
jgi:hypothetical protein